MKLYIYPKKTKKYKKSKEKRKKKKASEGHKVVGPLSNSTRELVSIWGSGVVVQPRLVSIFPFLI
jgi:hypothetical protein